MNRNVTLSLPAEILRRLKVVAAERGTSISRMLTESLDEILSREAGYERARRRSLATLDQGWSLGTRGRAGWRRDELHER